MVKFLAGVATGVVAVLLAVLVGAMMLRPASDAPPPPARPTPTAIPSPQAGETVLGHATLTSSQVQTTDGELTDIAASGEGLTLAENGLRANRLTINATLPFHTAQEQIGQGVTLYQAPGGRAGVRATMSFLGQELGASAVAAVRAEDGQLVITPESVDVGGPAWLNSAATSAATTFLTIRHTIGGLPDGMRLIAVSVQENGFRVRLEGSQVAITRAPGG